MLKHRMEGEPTVWIDQPPSGGCVLKHQISEIFPRYQFQPPSGGCVLKQQIPFGSLCSDYPAAFRRLCVETKIRHINNHTTDPAAFRRLCVETCPLWLPIE